jgi:hypothetical protein
METGFPDGMKIFDPFHGLPCDLRADFSVDCKSFLEKSEHLDEHGIDLLRRKRNGS